jgi:DNA-binding NtrC family response regulator
VELYRQGRGHIDLVILDLAMPRVSGREALQKLLHLDPGVRVLFASGYAAEQVAPEEQRQVLGFVAKPYRPEELIRLVRHALEGTGSRRD